MRSDKILQYSVVCLICASYRPQAGVNTEKITIYEKQMVRDIFSTSRCGQRAQCSLGADSLRTHLTERASDPPSGYGPVFCPDEITPTRNEEYHFLPLKCNSWLRTFQTTASPHFLLLCNNIVPMFVGLRPVKKDRIFKTQWNRFPHVSGEMMTNLSFLFPW